jgi:hypothetical protein
VCKETDGKKEKEEKKKKKKKKEWHRYEMSIKQPRLTPILLQ